jgi:hypothetical protein
VRAAGEQHQVSVGSPGRSLRHSFREQYSTNGSRCFDSCTFPKALTIAANGGAHGTSALKALLARAGEAPRSIDANSREMAVMGASGALIDIEAVGARGVRVDQPPERTGARALGGRALGIREEGPVRAGNKSARTLRAQEGAGNRGGSRLVAVG